MSNVASDPECFQIQSSDNNSIPESPVAYRAVAERQFDWREQDGIVIVSLKKARLIEDSVIISLFNQLNTLVEDVNQPQFILDFSRVNFLGTTSLGQLIRIEKKLRTRSAQLQLCGIHKNVFQIFRITRLDEYFKIQPTLVEAIANC